MEYRGNSRQLKALLFTDLVDSTALSTRVGPDRSDELRTIHFEILRTALGDHEGTEVKNTGDGVFAVFESVRNAVDCAEAMQQGFEVYRRRADEPMEIRVGVSVGEVVADEEDYFGTSVVEAARLCDAAGSSEVFVTSVSAMLLVGTDHTFEDLGPLDLKGLDPTPTARFLWTQSRGSRSVIAAPPALAAHPAHGTAGRAAELELIAERWTAAENGSAQAVFVSGEPGLGKTHLAATAARAAAERGASVALGRCDASLGVPYQPWIEVLDHVLGASPADVRNEIVADHGDVLGRVVPSLPAPSTPAPDPELERFRLFEAVIDVVRRLAAHDPVLVVLDDLQWADVGSLQLTRRLLDSPDVGAAMIIGTYRDTDIDGGHPLQEVLEAVARSDAAETVELVGLDDDAIRELALAITGDAPDDLVHRVGREADGNAFFAIELLVNADEAGADHELPSSVRQVVMQRVRRAGDDVVATLQQAAVIGAEFDISLLAAAARADEDDVFDDVEAAARASLVREVGTDRFAFSHALVATTLLDELGASQAARSSRRIAKALAEGPYDHEDRRLGEYARHRLRGHREGEEDEVIDLLGRAADQAIAALSPHQAADWHRQAIALQDTIGAAESAQRVESLVGLGVAQRDMGSGDFRQTLLDAADLAERIGEPALVIQAAVLNSRGIHSQSGGADEERLAVINRALDHAGPESTADRARLLTLAAAELIYTAPLHERLELSNEALAIARRLNDPMLIARVLIGRHNTIQHPTTLEERLDNTIEAIELADQTDDPGLQWWAQETRLRPLGEVGDVDAVAVQLDEITNRAEKLGQPSRSWYVAWQRAWLVLLHGDDITAERLGDEALALGFATGQPDAMEIYASLLINLRLHQGRLAEILPLVEQTSAENPGIPGFRAVLGFIHADGRDVDAVRRVLAEDIEADFATFPTDMVWATGLACCAEAVAEARIESAAQRLYDLLLPSRHAFIHPGPATFGSTERYLGRLATVVAPERADEHFAAALAAHQAARAPYWIARTRLDQARFAADDGRASDARTHALAARDAARDIGNSWLHDQLDQLAT